MCSPSCPSCPSSAFSPSCPTSTSCPVSSSLFSIWVTNGMRRIDRTRSLVHANRAERSRLEDAHQLQPNHLEQREERHDETATVVDVGEQILESHRFGLRQPREQLIDSHFDGNL